jgi:glycosyltransferase involved in cell wall biosynthesis
MDRSEVAPEVWCRRDGPVRDRYEALGIPCHVAKDMPYVTAVERPLGNVVDFFNFARRWPSTRACRDALVEAAGRFDLFHFNHEGLFLLLRHLRRRVPGLPMTMHIRTFIPENVVSRWNYRVASRCANRLAFITENERDWVRRYSGHEPTGSVIYNIAAPPADVTLSALVPRDGRLKIAVLSNYDYVRGIDRAVEVAEILAARGRRDILFVMVGNMALRESLPGELGRVARAGGTLADYAKVRGVVDMFLFLGHVAAPEPVLQACDVLLKPTREDNPWGRDILEALAFGKPVISVGRYERFVENGKTGVLMPAYSAEGMADHILRFDADRSLVESLGHNARAHIAELCDGPRRAVDLVKLWREAISSRRMAAE